MREARGAEREEAAGRRQAGEGLEAPVEPACRWAAGGLLALRRVDLSFDPLALVPPPCIQSFTEHLQCRQRVWMPGHVDMDATKPPPSQGLSSWG